MHSDPAIESRAAARGRRRKRRDGSGEGPVFVGTCGWVEDVAARRKPRLLPWGRAATMSL
ncbi:hypothetical protein ACIHFC_05135 [Streptomyces sp. NPDC052013]|uniref:hypothetical protein n=1 Tax=Streptomyces sp. NPDC052013 TaxID=3365679 RepID=UPI0037D3F971